MTDSREAFEAWFRNDELGNQWEAWQAAIAHVKEKLEERGYWEALEDDEVWK